MPEPSGAGVAERWRAKAVPLLDEPCEREGCNRVATRSVVVQMTDDPTDLMVYGRYCTPCSGDRVRQVNRELERPREPVRRTTARVVSSQERPPLVFEER